MRKSVPMLTNSLTSDQFLSLFVDSFQSVIFGTVDDHGHPHTNVADIELKDGKQLIFATSYQKPFYQRLMNNKQVSITALRGNETLDSVGITLDGEVQPVSSSSIEQIFAHHPEMQQISSNFTERKALLRAFAIIPREGSVYDLRQNPIFQKHFTF